MGVLATVTRPVGMRENNRPNVLMLEAYVDTFRPYLNGAILELFNGAFPLPLLIATTWGESSAMVTLQAALIFYIIHDKHLCSIKLSR